MRDRSGLRHRGVVVRRTEQRKAAVRNTPASDEYAVNDRQAPEELTDLVGAPQPPPDPFLDRKVRDVLPKELDSPRGGREVAGNGVEKRCLACPMRAENGAPLAGANPK